jgi:hypothetical protein
VDEPVQDSWQQSGPCSRSAVLLVFLRSSLTTYTDAERGQIGENVGDFKHGLYCVYGVGVCGRGKSRGTDGVWSAIRLILDGTCHSTTNNLRIKTCAFILIVFM